MIFLITNINESLSDSKLQDNNRQQLLRITVRSHRTTSDNESY